MNKRYPQIDKKNVTLLYYKINLIQFLLFLNLENQSVSVNPNLDNLRNIYFDYVVVLNNEKKFLQNVSNKNVINNLL